MIYYGTYAKFSSNWFSTFLPVRPVCAKCTASRFPPMGCCSKRRLMRGLSFFWLLYFLLTLHFWCVFFNFFCLVGSLGVTASKTWFVPNEISCCANVRFTVYSAIQILTVVCTVVFFVPNYTLCSQLWVCSIGPYWCKMSRCQQAKTAVGKVHPTDPNRKTTRA